MSGRLTILPKKTYCPWKPENVERVLRDERLDRQDRERQQARLHQEESRARWRALKGDCKNEEHFNLFQSNEEYIREQGTHNKSSKTTMKIPTTTTTLGELTRKRPCYLQVGSKTHDTLDLNDMKRKDAMDPMQQFLKSCPEKKVCHTQERSKSQSSSRRRNTNMEGSVSTGTSMDELRRRRQEREEMEAHRAACFTRKGLLNARSSRYQNQYNPGLSKK
jgi:hypothetical protein